jgi:hypothetical protein
MEVMEDIIDLDCMVHNLNDFLKGLELNQDKLSTISDDVS